jgi:stage V sporulation protein AE
MGKRKVILVTDGDRAAQKAVETATANIGGRCISSSGGNPTILTGEQLIREIKKAASEPVVVMVDDMGEEGKGVGEQAMEYIISDESIDVLGIVAVSSNSRDCSKIKVDCSITNEGKVIENAVDKYGNDSGVDKICGDTLSILKKIKDVVVVGLGDPGKMDFNDEVSKGAPVTTQALQEVIDRSSHIYPLR